MVNTLFIQFVEHINNRNETFASFMIDDKSSILSNGFSYVYDKCKNLGDFIWVDVEDNIELPISKGIVYVSVLYTRHLIQTFIWANKYPEINFIIGGPNVSLGSIFYKDKPVTIPSNMKITNRLAEEVILGDTRPSKKWYIDVPDNLNKNVFFSYPVQRDCYWKQCLFCGERKNIHTFSNNTDSLYIPNNDYNWIIRLSTPALSPKFIRDLLPVVPKASNIQYEFFMRADTETISSLEKVLDKIPDNTMFHVGLECPSNRMLELMRKGTSTYNYLSLVKLLNNTSHIVRFSLMDGWNLIPEDIAEIENFFVNLDNINNKNILLSLYKTFIPKPDDPFHRVLGSPKLKTIDWEAYEGYDYRGYLVDWDKDTDKLNRYIRALYKSAGYTIYVNNYKYRYVIRGHDE